MARVALTFDDGPSPHTAEIADLIAAHGGRGTFFVLGQAVAGNEPLLRRMAGAGHELGNHTHSHPHCGDLDEQEIRDELVRAQREISAAAGVEPALVRPPYGEDADRVGRIAVGLGLGCALWTVDPLDWRERSAERITKRVLDGLHPDAVVDFHDGWPAKHRGVRDRTPTVEALRTILPELGRRGYEAVTLSAIVPHPATHTSPSS
ncbi:MAG TPA: polysaccharide deacetylase family protein [Gaiellales bacterium]|nr:polysaccharide deacetylase family protein [Gaiellales bacterium]